LRPVQVSLRPVPADKVIKVLVKVGFKPVRQRGSHIILTMMEE
jgi:predicted RNA binding protein YcfA (HicA-like mRNA interferase family)